MLRTSVYIDGFNLYHGGVRGTPHLWLDLVAMSRAVLGTAYDVQRVKYFTSRVTDDPQRPGRALRQDVYLRALRAFRPEVETVLGHFEVRDEVSKAQDAKPLRSLGDGRADQGEGIRREPRGSRARRRVG